MHVRDSEQQPLLLFKVMLTLPLLLLEVGTTTDEDEEDEGCTRRVVRCCLHLLSGST